MASAAAHSRQALPLFSAIQYLVLALGCEGLPSEVPASPEKVSEHLQSLPLQIFFVFGIPILWQFPSGIGQNQGRDSEECIFISRSPNSEFARNAARRFCRTSCAGIADTIKEGR